VADEPFDVKEVYVIPLGENGYALVDGHKSLYVPNIKKNTASTDSGWITGETLHIAGGGR
jgi:hypothetical protein